MIGITEGGLEKHVRKGHIVPEQGDKYKRRMFTEEALNEFIAKRNAGAWPSGWQKKTSGKK